MGNVLKDCGKNREFRDRNKKGLYPLTASTCTLELATLTSMSCAHYHDSNKIHFLEEFPELQCQSYLVSSSPHLGRELQIYQGLPFTP